MSDGGNLGPPPIPFRINRQQLPHLGGGRWLVAIVAAGVLFAAISILRGVYTSYLWFDSVGFASVYQTEIVTRTWLFFAGALIFLVFLGVNLYLARRLSPSGLEESFIPEMEVATLKRIVRIAAIAGALFLAVIFGSVASSEWDTVLRLLHGASFGVSDPAFHKDVGFYMFTLPALRFFQQWLVGMIIVTLIAVAGVYAFALSLQNFEVHLSRSLKGHAGALIVLLLLVFAAGYYLSIFELNLAQNGVVQGATYTDIHARVPGYYVLIGVTLLVCAGVAWGVFGDRYIPAIAAGALWIVALILALGVYPASVQNLSVSPNELATESPYIQRNIDSTRAAFNLTQIDEQPFAADSSITQDTISQNQATINNLRLWDPRYTLNTFRQQQELRQNYVFQNVDVDRYSISGAYTEVTTSARELPTSSLAPNQKNWQNIHLAFTHGFGAVMNPVNKTDSDGLPVYNLKDIPPQGMPTISQPRIYFGETDNGYAIVDASLPEFDYETVANQSETFRYDANRGISIGSLLRRLAFAWDLGDTNILISKQITGDSRLLIHRNIRDRIQSIAPFLTLDQDPYITVIGGKLLWIQDAYTTSTNYPYSEAEDAVGNIIQGTNYIRNSVKVTVDAYSGDVTFYVMDPTDPVIKTYENIFPSLFRPASDMSAELRAHLRYPEDLFTMQANAYRAYHMTDPRVFYNKEDLWATPREGSASNTTDVVPYYVIMQLPGQTGEEFVLIRPFTPANKANAVAWMGARMDGDNYGKLAVYQFPSSVLTTGPAQVESTIDAEPEISQRFSLLNVQGSHVLRGNLLMIPLGTSYLYVEPVYLEADQNPIPAVIAVIVFANGKVFMEPTLDQALAVALGKAPPTFAVASAAASAVQNGAAANSSSARGAATPSAGATPRAGQPAPSSLTPITSTDVPGLVREAQTAEQQAEQDLRNGDFAAYGQEQDRLRALLDQLNSLVGPPIVTATPAR